jgi:phage tail sheath gpL-like
MPISFDSIPANWRMPLYWAEIDPSQAGLPIVRNIALIVGTMNAQTNKEVDSAVVAAGGTGHAVNDQITLQFGVVVTVGAVTAGAITAATVTDAGSFPGGVTTPPNPLTQVSSTGAGIGASFNVTWVDSLATNDHGGVGTPWVPKPIGTQAEADQQFGIGSEISSMVRAFLANNFAQEMWCLPVPPAPGSTAASANVQILTPATEAGTLHLYVAGHHIDNVNVRTTDTVAQIAATLAAGINEDPTLPVVATQGTSPDDDTVTITCKTPGINGNDITLQLNYYGKVGGQETPPGVTLTVPARLGQGTGGVVGAGIPDYDLAISAMGEHEFEYITLPHTDSNTLFDWEQEFSFGDSGRWGWMRQLYGHLFCAKRDTYSNLIIYGETRNMGTTSIMGIEPEAASPSYEWAAAYCAKAARALTNDPARPLQTLRLDRMLAAQPERRFNLPELNSLAGVGIATQKTGTDNIPRIMRETTTAQLNEYGQSDDAYELVTTLATIARLIRNQRQALTSKFPRHKLGNDGIRVGVGQKLVTPKSIKAELVAQYRIDEFNGLVEDVTAFKEHLLVERDSNNPNRCNILYPPDLVNQLRVLGVLVQFRLQYNRGQDLEIIR